MKLGGSWGVVHKVLVLGHTGKRQSLAVKASGFRVLARPTLTSMLVDLTQKVGGHDRLIAKWDRVRGSQRSMS